LWYFNRLLFIDNWGGEKPKEGGDDEVREDWST
jgi:hypothetical protein